MIYWIQRKRLITILVLGTRWITIKVYKILKEFKGIDFQGKATFYLLSYFKFEFPKVIKSFFNPMNFTSSQFVLSSSNFYLTQHSLIYIQNKFYSPLIITCFFIFLYLFIFLRSGGIVYHLQKSYFHYGYLFPHKGCFQNFQVKTC